MYTAQMSLIIKTVDDEEFEKIVAAIRKEYDAFLSADMPDDIDVDFSLNVKKETIDVIVEDE